MSNQKVTRRELMQIGGATLLTSALASRALARPSKPKQILYFTKSSGFEHSVVRRPDGKLSHSEKILIEIGKKHGYEVTPCKDGRVFDGDLSKYDAFAFYTSGDLTKVGKDKGPAMSAAGKQALFDAVAGGTGFLGIHAATDTFRRGKGEVDPYTKMIGGMFCGHNAQQKARMTVVDSKFPGMGKLGKGFELHEEWYAIKDFTADLHVLLVNETQGMRGPAYQRPPFPGTWARKHGKGNVFYTSLGHREDIWTNPLFEQIIVGALSWVTGQVEVEIPSNMEQVTPKADQLTR